MNTEETKTTPGVGTPPQSAPSHSHGGQVPVTGKGQNIAATQEHNIESTCIQGHNIASTGTQGIQEQNIAATQEHNIESTCIQGQNTASSGTQHSQRDINAATSPSTPESGTKREQGTFKGKSAFSGTPGAAHAAQHTAASSGTQSILDPRDNNNTASSGTIGTKDIKANQIEGVSHLSANTAIQRGGKSAVTHQTYTQPRSGTYKGINREERAGTPMATQRTTAFLSDALGTLINRSHFHKTKTSKTQGNNNGFGEIQEDYLSAQRSSRGEKTK